MSLRDSTEWKDLEGIANLKYRWPSLIDALVAAPASAVGRKTFTELRQFYLLGIIAGLTATQIAVKRQKAERIGKPKIQKVHSELRIIEEFLLAVVPETFAKLKKSKASLNQADWLRCVLEGTEYAKITNQENLISEDGLVLDNDSILDFIGRKEELEELKLQIKSGARLIHIYGRQGEGKSSLAMKLIQDLKEDSNYEPCYVNLRHELSFNRFSNKILRCSADTMIINLSRSEKETSLKRLSG